MIRKLLHRYSDKFLSKWIVLFLDITAVFISLLISALLRFEFNIDDVVNQSGIQHFWIVCLTYATGFVVVSSHSGILRHSGVKDAYLVLRGALIALAMLLIIAGQTTIPRSVLLIHFILSVFVLISMRFIVRTFYNHYIKTMTSNRRVRTVIFGAGVLGRITYNTLKGETSTTHEVIGFIDDNEQKWNKRVDGVPIQPMINTLSAENVSKKRIHQLIIAVKDLDPTRKNEIVEKCLSAGIRVKTVPDVNKWISGSLSFKQIKEIRIEDLLEREPIKLDSVNVSKAVRGRTVLVTGAAGSIGSEISRQVMYYKPRRVIFIDNAESDLHNLEISVLPNIPELDQIDVNFILGDITIYERMRSIFDEYRPDVVYHAAAYKHVPIIERFPVEGVRVNCLGTKILADLSIAFGVHKFVMVSTDKAVNPTNVMGATKRMAEMYVQSLQIATTSTSFVITRFGNVLGSNGSVLPLFRKQIKDGGPLTITHPDITRFFMTIPEACNLVLEAGAMGNGGEIFVFDMGKSIKVLDLARKMILLSGLKPDFDVKIKFVGLRPGEKLYEELLNDKEAIIPTHHKKIMKAKVQHPGHDTILLAFSRFSTYVEDNLPIELVKCLKEYIPEFKSNNSDYEIYDVEKIDI